LKLAVGGLAEEINEAVARTKKLRRLLVSKLKWSN
jgi:hypothetical protein